MHTRTEPLDSGPGAPHRPAGHRARPAGTATGGSRRPRSPDHSLSPYGRLACPRCCCRLPRCYCGRAQVPDGPNSMSGRNPPLRGTPHPSSCARSSVSAHRDRSGARRPRGNDERHVRSIVPGVIAVV